MYNCNVQSYLPIFVRSSNVWSFVYSFAETFTSDSHFLSKLHTLVTIFLLDRYTSEYRTRSFLRPMIGPKNSCHPLMIRRLDAKLRFKYSRIPAFSTCIRWRSHKFRCLTLPTFAVINLYLGFSFNLDRRTAWKSASLDVVLLSGHFLYPLDCFRNVLYMDVFHSRWWHQFVQDCQEPYWWYVWQACPCPWQPVSQSCPGIPHSC